MQVNIAIIGLGIIGGSLLKSLVAVDNTTVKIRAVAELGFTPGLIFAKDKQIPVMKLEQILTLGNDIDLIYDTTDSPHVRTQIRETLKSENNHHTVLIPETGVSLLMHILGKKELPDIHVNKGY